MMSVDIPDDNKGGKDIIDLNQSHFVDTLRNQDKVLKECIEIYKGRTLEFLDVELDGSVTEILSTEITETTTKKAYGDSALKLSTNKGASVEWETDVSKDDLRASLLTLSA